jgi:hypothetical protein
MKEYSVGVGVTSRHETDRGEWSLSCPGCCNLGYRASVTNLLEGRVCPRPSLIIGENHNPLDVQLVVFLVYKLNFFGLQAKLS